MKFELWDMVSYGHAEPAVPFSLIKKSNSFSEIYMEFSRRIKNVPCVIFIKEEKVAT